MQVWGGRGRELGHLPRLTTLIGKEWAEKRRTTSLRVASG